MATSDELQSFVRDALGRGTSRADVERVLVRSGWGRRQAQAALGAYADVEFPIPVPRPRVSLDARDAFLYLLSFSTLYLSAIHLGNLLFDLINRTFPDPVLSNPAYVRYSAEALRWSIASLIVAPPVFVFVNWRIRRAVDADPGKRGSPIRRWLTYLTLAIASGVLIGDFITLAYYWLGGEMTIRTVLKALTVAAIGGGVFGAYLRDVRERTALDFDGGGRTHRRD